MDEEYSRLGIEMTAGSFANTVIIMSDIMIDEIVDARYDTPYD